LDSKKGKRYTQKKPNNKQQTPNTKPRRPLMTNDYLRIDSHQHFWKYDPVRYSWLEGPLGDLQKDFLPEDLAPLLEEHNFDGCLAVQADQSESETEFLLKLAMENNFVKGVVGWIDLTNPNSRKRLEHFSKNLLFKGLRHIVYDKQGEFMEDPAFQSGISHLKEFGLTYDILAFEYQLPGAVKLVEQFPEQAFVLDHMGKPQISKGVSPEWEQNIIRLAEYPNVYCKLSGLVTETRNFQWDKQDFQPFLKVVVEAFGIDRLMFGSDWPVCLAAANYKQTVEIIHSYFEHDFSAVEKVFGKTAARFYNIQ
jgi:L-fuconolactonase